MPRCPLNGVVGQITIAHVHGKRSRIEELDEILSEQSALISKPLIDFHPLSRTLRSEHVGRTKCGPAEIPYAIRRPPADGIVRKLRTKWNTVRHTAICSSRTRERNRVAAIL